MTTDTPNRPAHTAHVIASPPGNFRPHVDPETQTALLEQARRDAAEGVALRTFRVDPYAGPRCHGVLLPVVGTDATVWGPTGYAVAESGRGRDHPAPDPDCTCGIYGTTDINALTANHPLLASNIVAVIDCDPRYSYQEGDTIRALSGRVVAYWCHPSRRVDSARRVLAETHAEAFTDRDEMIAAYLPDNAPRPVTPPPLDRPAWRDALAAAATYGFVPPTLRRTIGVVRDAVKYAVVPSLLAYGIATIAHAAARPDPGHTDEFRLSAQQFVTSGRHLFGRLIEAGLPTTVLLLLLALGTTKGLLASRGYPGPALLSGLASMGANIIRYSGRLILPVFVFLCMLAHAAHLPQSTVLDVVWVLAYLGYFGVTFGPATTAAVVTLWRQAVRHTRPEDRLDVVSHDVGDTNPMPACQVLAPTRCPVIDPKGIGMHVVPDRDIERRGGRIATMEVSYARLVEMFGEPNAPAGELDAGKVSAEWLLATSEGPTWVYNWLPATDYRPAETTSQWHIGGSRAEVVVCVAEALKVSAHIHWWDPRQKRVIDTTVAFRNQSDVQSMSWNSTPVPSHQVGPTDERF
jgi:hypothetical protein